MKKLYILFTCIITLLSVFAFNSVYASELTFDNTINDESTISEDFEALGLKLSDYYISKKHTIDKWYCVAVAESIINTNYDIQTYFYLYNPTVSPNDYITLNYKLNGAANSVDVENIEYSSTYGLLKVKGFKYAYTSASTIDVYSISWVVDVDTMDGYGFASSDFTATTNHSISDKLIDVRMDFQTTLVIEDYNVVEVNVTEDDNFFNNWDYIWDCERESLNIYFYNFNFPDHIEYDSVEYAKFKYVRNRYFDVIFNEKYSSHNTHEILSSEPVINEYYNHNKNGSINTNTLRVNDDSIEMSFDVFHLGNRYKDGQFTFDEEKIVSGDLNYFDVDCSILIDSTYKTKKDVYNLNVAIDAYSDEIEYETLDEVELIELHYENDGVLYECRVIQTDGPVDNEDFGNVTVEDEKDKEWWEKFWDWFLDNLPWSAVGCVAAIILAPVLISLLFGLLTGSISAVMGGLLSIIKKIFSGLASILKKTLKLLFKFIVWLIKLPFTILKFIFGLFKK